MPNIKSAKKRMRQSRAANVRNRDQRAALRTAIKKVRNAPTAEAARAAYAMAEQLIDRAAGKNLLHKNAAARHKSRLLKSIAARA